MGIEDKDYMIERARKRLKEQNNQTTFKGEFNDNKYKDREWSVKSSKPLHAVPADPWQPNSKQRSKFLEFFRHRSGKDVPVSLWELIMYALIVIFIIWALDKPHLPFGYRFFVLATLSFILIYILRQIKVRMGG